MSAEEMADLLDRLGTAATEVRDLIRDAHAAAKDLRQASRDAQTMLAKMAEAEVSERLEGAVEKGLEEYKATLAEAIERSTDAVFRRFDTLANIMLGKGEVSDLEAMAHRKLANRQAMRNREPVDVTVKKLER